MNATFAPILWKFAIIFFDDILIYRSTYANHLEHLRSVLELLCWDKWQVKKSKCAFATCVAYLVHVISGEGVATDDSTIASIVDWVIPTNLKEVCGFLDITGYYRKFIRHYSIISQPLIALLKKGTLFRWTDTEQAAFQTLKNALVSAPVLALPDFTVQFVIETDAGDTRIGAMLSQRGHPLGFVSRMLGHRN
jgi:hypothetical protein